MISKTAAHALNAMAVLAERPDEFQGAASVAERVGAPQNYLGKILQSLIGSGVVYSRKGMGGGFQLARAPETISLFEIVEPFDRVSRWEGCCLGRDACSSDDPCALHEKWAVIRDAYLKTLKETTLADLVAHEALSVIE